MVAKAPALPININTDGRPVPTKKRRRTSSKALRSSSPPFLLFPPLPPPGTFDLVQRVAMSTTAFMLPRFFAHETPLFSVSLVRCSLSAI